MTATKISYFPVRFLPSGGRDWATVEKNISISDVLGIIKRCTLSKEIAAIRAEPDHKKQNILKEKTIPFVTFPGTFNYRDKKSIKQPAGLMPLDADEIGQADFKKIRSKLEQDKFTRILYETPSGFRLKLAFAIPVCIDDAIYKKYFYAAQEYLFTTYGILIDDGGSDICRASFLSADDKLYFNSQSDVFDKMRDSKMKIPGNGKAPKVEPGASIPDGQRNNTLISWAGKMRHIGMNFDEILAALIEKNRACDPPLPAAEVEEIAKSVSRYEPGRDFDESRLTDLGLCQRFCREHGDKLRFCPNLGDWLIWDGCRWAADDRDRVFQLAKKTVQQLYLEAANSKDELYRKAVGKFAIASEAAAKIAAFLTLAKRELTIPIRDLDADSALLNCKTAVINFRTGEILPPTPEMMITMTTAAAHDPGAKCPLWRKTLDEIFEGDQARQRGFQKVKGYSLLGENQERKLIIDYQTGANGKSVVNNTVCNLLGDYGCNIPAYSLMVTFRPDAIRNDLAMLKGKRFVLASEGPKNSILSDDMMKLLAGGSDKITSRFLHKEFFTYKPSFTVFLMTNHLPKVDADDPAVWDRIVVFPFNRRFEEHERNLKLEFELIAEWPGILNWMIEGAKLAKSEGLGLGGIPEIAAATKEYREKQDLVGRFIADECEVNRDFSCRAGVLWERFIKWFKENQEKDSYTQNRFADGMKRLGYVKERRGGKVTYFGIKPIFDEPPAVAYGENS